MPKSMNEKREQTKKARKTKENSAQQHDMILEKKIQEIPGLTYVQLEKVFSKNEYKFKKSYLKNALHRLEKFSKIIVIHSISKEGKIVNKYYSSFSKKQLLDKRINELTIPSELVEIKEWKNTCIIYGIKNNELLIAPKQDDRLEESAFYKKITKCKKTSEKLLIEIPKIVADYYNLTINNIYITYPNNTISILVTPIFVKEDLKDKFTILLLEDNPFWSKVFQNKFSSAGHAVFPFVSINAAEEFCKNQQIDWLILDDEIDHMKEAKKFFIKLKKTNPKIHGIFITSYPITEKKREDLTELGFSSIIEKKSNNKERDPEEIAAEQLVRVEV